MTARDLAVPFFLLLLLGGKSGRRSKGRPAKGVFQWIPLVKEATAGTKVPPGIVLAIIDHESKGDPNAKLFNKPTKRRPQGSTDWGLMQVNDITLQTYGVPRSRALDPEVNVATGVALLEDLIERWGDWKYAIAAYAAGSGTIQKSYPHLSERLQNFVDYVLDRADSYGV